MAITPSYEHNTTLKKLNVNGSIYWMKDADHKECCYGDDKSEKVHIVKEKPPSPQRGELFL